MKARATIRYYDYHMRYYLSLANAKVQRPSVWRTGTMAGRSQVEGASFFFFGRTDVEKSPEFSWNYQDYLRNTIHKNVENHMFFRSDNKFSTNGGENHICLVSLQEGHEKL